MQLDQVRQLALALPEAVEAPHFDCVSFRVRAKIFATLPPGGSHLHLFLDEIARETALALYPQCSEKLLWGGKVVGLRLCLDRAETSVVERLLRDAWRRKAPKRLTASFGA